MVYTVEFTENDTMLMQDIAKISIRFTLPNNIHIVCYCRKLQMFCQDTDLVLSCINHDTATSFPQRPSYSDRSTDSTVTGSEMGCSAACTRSPRMTAS